LIAAVVEPEPEARALLLAFEDTVIHTTER
jgi:hypothetical protein